MTNQAQHAEHKDKASPQRQPSKPARQGPVASKPDGLALQRAIADPDKARPADILALQRAAGNRAVTRLIQAKLTVGPAGDRYEQEADRVADQVMSMQLPPAGRGGGEVQRQPVEEEEIQTKPLAASITPLVQRAPEDEEEIQTFPSPARRGAEGEVQRVPEEEEEVQTKSIVQRRADGGFDAGPEVEGRLSALKGGGSPLSDEVRATMEPRFGADFSGVRIHTGGEADHLNRQLSAEAFTHGEDIYFKSGTYNPGSGTGRRLLAHELAHTVQQGAGRRIARWTFGGHKKITEDTFKTYGLDRHFSPFAQATLAMKSATMDARAKNIASFVFGKFLVAKFMKAGAFPRIPSELPNHGEAGGYHKKGLEAVDENHVMILTLQAVQEMKAKNPMSALGILGDAIHASEDRGSHGDGNPGTGHDPKCIVPHRDWQKWAQQSDWRNEPEAKLPQNPFFRSENWNPDDITMNYPGYLDAQAHAAMTMFSFLGRLTPEETNILKTFGKTAGHVVGGALKTVGHVFGLGH